MKFLPRLLLLDTLHLWQAPAQTLSATPQRHKMRFLSPPSEKRTVTPAQLGEKLKLWLRADSNIRTISESGQ